MFSTKISVDYQHSKDIKTYVVPDAFYTYLSMRKIGLNSKTSFRDFQLSPIFRIYFS
jgi:hypothetical protein